MEWPEWWSWDLELSSHLLKRMTDRRFSETDLRAMLADATGYHAEVEAGRWVIETHHEGRRWEIIVEPVAHEGMTVVVTAYPLIDR
jgi:hypothetical protein